MRDIEVRSHFHAILSYNLASLWQAAGGTNIFVNHKSHQRWHGAENAIATATPTTAPER
jgi:hypothetical protein